MTGRPTSYTDEVADEICSELVEGRSLKAICLDEGMPHRATVFRWLADERYTSFRDRYARAREAQADAIFDEILDIADDGSNDWMARDQDGDEGDQVLNHEHIQRSRLRIDARKWMAAKLRPKVYGDKSLIEHTGADGGPIAIKDATEETLLEEARRLGIDPASLGLSGG